MLHWTTFGLVTNFMNETLISPYCMASKDLKMFLILGFGHSDGLEEHNLRSVLLINTDYCNLMLIYLTRIQLLATVFGSVGRGEGGGVGRKLNRIFASHLP